MHPKFELEKFTDENFPIYTRGRDKSSFHNNIVSIGYTNLRYGHANLWWYHL